MAKLPLEDLHVLDLTHMLPGPLLTLMMADLGATVVKIEKPPYGDLNRRVPPFIHDISSYFLMLNRNKKSLSLDLKTEAGKKKFLTFVKKADVLVENFRPGAMKRLGLDYPKLKKLNPKLIYCAITGFGQRSPWKTVAGHDLNYTALSGLLSATAYPEKRPAMLSTQISDIVGGSLMGMISVMAALEYRRKNKKGLFVDMSMLAGTMVLQMMILGKFLATGEELFQESDRMTGLYPNYTIYETKDHRYMAVGAIEPKFWNRFCDILGAPDFKSWIPLDDPPGFPTLSLARCSVTQLTKMKQKVQNIFKQKTWVQWKKLFDADPDVCCTPVNTLGEAMQLLKELGLSDLFYLKDQQGRSYPQYAFPFGNKNLVRKHHKLP